MAGSTNNMGQVALRLDGLSFVQKFSHSGLLRAMVEYSLHLHPVAKIWFVEIPGKKRGLGMKWLPLVHSTFVPERMSFITRASSQHMSCMRLLHATCSTWNCIELILILDRQAISLLFKLI